MINHYVTFYLLAGLILGLIIEVLNNAEIEGYIKKEMTNGQRVLLVLVWPLYMLIFLIALFKNIFKR